MNKYLALICLFVTGCIELPIPDIYSPYDYGYHYTDVTPMGIKYRVDDSVELNPSYIDYYFSNVMACTGATFDPENLLIISTSEDAAPGLNYLLEGWTWQPRGDKPAMIVINSVQNPEALYYVLTHEFVHVLLKTDTHQPVDIFSRCGYRYY